MEKNIITKKITRKIVLILVVLTYFLQNFGVALAQENLTAEISTPSSQLINNDILVNSQASDTISPTPSLDISQNQPSAQFKTPTIIRSLKKKSFRANEKITVDVDNIQGGRVDAEVLDSEGNKTDFDVFTVDNGLSKTVIVNPPRVFKPGKYQIKVSTGSTSYTQDFTWGVLAINTDKSVYLPYEVANLAIGVLDENGEMVCDANVELVITSPNANSKTLSTGNGLIKINPECTTHEVTLVPDYESHYQVEGEGDYQMVLTAQTKNGTYTIFDNFQVKNFVPFDVKRQTATRIYPPNPYPVTFTIKANQDFDGTITEIVPGSFAVTPASDSQYPFTKTDEMSPTSVDQVLGASDSANLALPFSELYPISQEFGEKLKDESEKNFYSMFNLSGHDGVDFDMPISTPINAVDDGKVVLAGNGAYGTTVVIEHSWGKSYYGHLSKVNVNLFDEVKKGDEIALSGNTGITTGPHLHFGIKPLNPDMQNGYYGKIDPLPLLGIKSALSSELKVQLLTWKVALKKGDVITLGYFYKAPNVSPDFYKLGPLRFYQESQNIFQEARQWQIAVDADGSGTNTITPTTGATSNSSQTYTFTYTTGESVATGSGSFTIQEPSADDWTVPQTSNSGAAGYLTVDASSTGTVGTVLDNADANTSWTNVGANACGGVAPTVSTLTKPEGSGNLQCVLGNVSAGHGFGKNISSSNWTSYTTVGAWVKTTVQITTSDLAFAYDDTASLASPIERIATSNPTTIPANIWTWVRWTFGSTSRSAVVSFGFLADSASGIDSRTVSVDYILIGPGTPTVSGSSPWVITVPIITIPATTGTIVLKYGSGGGSAGVTNSATEGVHTFTTKSKIATNQTNTLTNISAHPTVTLSSGPTLDQVLRHGMWFSNGAKAPFTF